MIGNAFSKFVTLQKDAQSDEERSRFDGYKQQMLLLLTSLCDDSIPIVRRSAIITLGKMVSVLSDCNEVLTSYLPLFKKLANDDQDNVRVFAVETLIEFSHIFDNKLVLDHLLYHIRLLALDQAWRVRYIAADNFIKLCKMLDTETIRDSMINYFIRLLQDQEPEVRAVAISKIPGISRLIGVDLSISKLIPIISKELITDSNKYARASLASVIIPFCYLLPHQIVIDHILSCILKILKDEYPNVRLHVISNICDHEEEREDDDAEKSKSTEIEIEVEYEEEVTVEVDENGNEIEAVPDDRRMDVDENASDSGNKQEHYKTIKRKKKRMEKKQSHKMKKFDISLLEESIIPSIMELTLDNDWRVRLGIIEKFPALAQQFGLKFFNDRLFDLCLASLEDNVADIRLSAASNLSQIATIFNNFNKDNYKWTTTKLIPALITKIHDSKHYLHRLIYLLSFKYLSENLGVDKNGDLVKEIMHFLSEDVVANVRFKACQIVKFLIKHKLIHSEYLKVIRLKLQHMIHHDDDVDVRYFATQSMIEFDR